MTADRFPERSDYQHPRTTMWVWLVSTFSAAFLIQLVLLSPKLRPTAQLLDKLDLTVDSLKHGELWTLITHSLIGSPLLIAGTVLALILLGRELEPQLGSRRFLALFAGSIVAGALCWTAVHWQHGGTLVGASSAILALLVVLARINAGTETTAWRLPVNFRLQHAIWAILAVEVLGLVFYEIFGAAAPLDLGLTPSADLGGMLAGWLFFKFVHAGRGWDRAGSFSFKPRQPPVAASQPVPASWRSGDLRTDVDHILDKINSQGFGSLTEEEKQTLDEAKDLLSKH